MKIILELTPREAESLKKVLENTLDFINKSPNTAALINITPRDTERVGRVVKMVEEFSGLER